MCGIAAIYARGPAIDDKEGVLLSMLHKQTHRGPDNRGTKTLDRCLLGSNRLRIVDASAASDQPLSSDDGLVHIVFNGEIFNHLALREPLLRSGSHFLTSSDTETILRLYLTYGIDMLDKLEGQFAICIYDQRCDRLLLARDRLGICPLFYVEHQSMVYVASSLTALVSSIPSITWSIDAEALNEYLLLRFVLAPRTIIQQIRAVAPAEAVVFERSEMLTHRYFSLKRLDGGSQERRAEELRERVLASVQQNTVCDASYGFFLSGGLDSSIVVAAASAVGRAPLQTLSIHLGEASSEETQHALIAASAFGSRHHLYQVDEHEVIPLLKSCLLAMDQPSGARDAFATFAMARHIKQILPDIKVVLTGTGADELFAGYCSAYFTPIAGSLEAQVHRYLQSYACTSTSALQTLRRVARHDLMLSNVAEEIAARMRRLFPDLPTEDPTNVLCTFYLTCHLPGWELPVQDMMCMASSLEARVPFLARPVVELAMQIDGARKWIPGREKAILRDAFRDLLPPPIRDRTKLPLSRPVADYLGRHGVRDLYRQMPFRERGIFNPNEVQTDATLAELDVFWRVLSLEHWLSQHVDQGL